MKVYISDKLVLERSKGTSVLRIMEILNLLEEEYLPYNPETKMPTTPDFHVPDDGEIVLLPILESLK